MEKTREIIDLVILLNQYRNDYYNLNKSTVSDSEYDKLFDELKQLEQEHGLILSNSPTQQVGYTVISKLQKVTHSIPLKSLDKTKSVEELQKWQGDEVAVAMLKGDGLTVELIYNEGKLIQGSTRGNGEIGEDITHNIPTFKGVPLTISYQGYLKTVGEAIIHKNDFDEINSKLPDDEKYATPRNLVSGSVRQLDSEVCAKRNVYFYAFGVVEGLDEIETKYEVLKKLGEFGFCMILNARINYQMIEDLDTLQHTIDTFKEVAETSYIPIDGLVFAFDSREYAASLGETSHHPLHSMAFKFEDEVAETTLTNIEWSVGRTGQITPVAIFETVLLDNTEVSRASLHNVSILEDLELGIGDKIGVQKCNLIIPQIAENYTRSNTIEIPGSCPACFGRTEIEQPNDSRVLKCTNDSCPAILLGRFNHFVSRDAMNIDGLSEATLEKFINAGFIKTFDDIYKLENHRDSIIGMDGFGVKSYDKLIKAINKSKKVKMNNFLYALGIPTIGRSASKTISKHFNGDWWAFESSIGISDFTRLEDFGQTMHDNIHKWYNSGREQLMWAKVSSILDFEKVEIKPIVTTDSQFSGKKVYATGTFRDYKKEEIKSVLEGLGAEFASGYAKSLDYLIVGSIKGSSKEDKAKKDGVTILSEDEFNKIIGK